MGGSHFFVQLSEHILRRRRMKIRAAQTTNPSAFLVNGNQDIVAAGRGADFPGQAAQLICIADIAGKQ